MKPWVALLIIGSAAIVCIIVWLMHSPKSEVLVSSGIALGPQWQEVHPEGNLQTKSVLSELLLEMPSQQIRQIGNQLYLGDGTLLHIEGYLVTEAGERFDLDRVGAIGYGTRTFLRLSAARLECKGCDYRFRLAALRSNKSVQTGKVIWMSYDPRASKDGVVFPRALE
jgi:hypothetical protein